MIPTVITLLLAVEKVLLCLAFTKPLKHVLVCISLDIETRIF